MSSALKPALPPGAGQTSPANPPSAPAKALTGGQTMSQHGGPPVPYATGPLAHMPQSLAGLPHAHGNLGGMPSTNSTNIAANMSINAMPTNMSGMASHPGVNQASPLTVPNKAAGAGAVLPPAVAAAGLGRPTAHPYLTGGSAAPTGAIQPPRDVEGTTLPLPASQNSAQLMAMHRAQQQHHPQQTPQPHHDQSVTDRFKQQQQQPPLQPQPQQAQSNGTVTEPSEPATCNNKTTTVPAPAAIQADAAKTETPPSAVPSVQNHVPTSSTTGTHEPNNDTKPPQAPTPTPTAAVPPEVTSSTSSSSTPSSTTTSPTTQPTPAVVDTKTIVVTPPTVEPEPAQSAAITPTKTVVVPKEPVSVKAPTTLKLATTPRTTNRKRETKPPKAPEIQKTSSPTKTQDNRSPGAQNNKPPDRVNKNRTPSEDERKSKRTRTRTQPYQSPIPELALITKLSSVSAASSPSKSQDDKLIVFYKNEFLAVRNAEGSFYVCQAVQNVYKSSPRIRIRWLSKDKQDKIYIPDFYDFTDFDCILTNINMERVEKGKYNLPKDELERTENILKRALAVESGASAPSLTEEHPDGLDLSLFRDESQLKKKRKSATKRKSTIDISLSEDSDDSDYDSKPKRTPDKAKLRRVSRTSSSRSSTKRNNQSSDRKSTTPNSSNDKKENVATKSGRRSVDGGRAERAKRRGEGSGASIPKTSPVIDQKKARVLAKTMKTTIPAATQSKKKVGKNAASAAKMIGNATASVAKTNTKTSTRSQGSVASSSSGVGSTAAASSSVLTTRRGKKTKK